MKILAISGSNRIKSINTAVLNNLKQTNPELEVTSALNFDAPLYNLDIEEKDGIPQGISDFINLVTNYDRIIISTPEHNGNLPVSLKNILDWASRQDNQFFANKKVAVLSVSPGARGGAGANQTLTQMLPFFGAEVVASETIGSFYDRFNVETFTFNDSSAEVTKLNSLIGALK